MTVTSLLKRVLPLKGFCYRSALWVEGAGPKGQGVIEVRLAARQGAKACCGRCGRRSPRYDRPEKVRCWQFISLWAIPPSQRDGSQLGEQTQWESTACPVAPEISTSSTRKR